jgi:hypothetical protein
MVLPETRNHAQANVTSGALTYAVVLCWCRPEQIRQRSILDFTGQCWLCRTSSLVMVSAALGLPPKLGVG